METLLKQILARLDSLESKLTPTHREPMQLDGRRIRMFLAWSRQEKRNSVKWTESQRRYLTWWGEQLLDVDLRRCSLQQHILPALDRVEGGRQPRIAVLKCFYAWLRRERHELTPAEDPTYGTLAVPQSVPAQFKCNKAVPRKDYLCVRRKLTEFWRPALDVLAGTGWHLTELERFVKAGVAVRSKGAGVLTCPRAKSGEVLRTRVSLPVLAAATALRKRGTLSEKRLREALHKASDLAGVKSVRPGVMRHSVATHAVDHGSSPADVAAFIGHRSERTLRRFYATHAIPKKVKTLAD